jgi:extracellular factor (EF) 3-hydroxypalmitic acid methyl ester biosynthesis protein
MVINKTTVSRRLMISELQQQPVVDMYRSAHLLSFQESLETMIRRGGPMPQEYAELNRQIRRLADEVRAGNVAAQEVKSLVRLATEEHFRGTMQAESVLKKHGYSGDFEIIDDIYRMRISPDAKQRRWDLFFHAQSAPCAVRNRKAYFHQLLRDLTDRLPGRALRVLNIASGPARDLREWFDANPESAIHFDCIELDPKAIAHASSVCGAYAARVTFHHQNALKFVPSERYDLIWSAGLFDYLTDRLFTRLVRSLMPFVKVGGEVVVGNFSEFNASRDYMELMGDWYLEHRSEGKLRELAEKAGAGAEQVAVRWEPEGVNLFVHVQL